MNQKKIDNGLYIVATPIGNLEDISFRAIEILKLSRIILCENPLHSSKLLIKYGIKKKLISIHDYNEEKIITKLSQELFNSIIALISDSGSPLISDPGFKIVQYCIKNKIKITSIPGPSSSILALQLSGISTNMFTFNGFISKKDKQAKELFEKIRQNSQTQIFFSSPHRLKKNIELMLKSLGNRKIAICRELTKINEEVIRTNILDAINDIKNKKIKEKGEFVLIVEGNISKNVDYLNQDTSLILSDLLKKFSLTDTVNIVHKLTGLSKKKLYNDCLKELKNNND